MDIQHLLTFVTVTELNSFTKAAERLGYSQSTVSFQIKQLELELDCLLFERINHTLRLTDRGRAFWDYAQKVCRMTTEFQQENRKEKEIRGTVRVLTPDSICEAMMLDNYADFFSRYPGIRLQFSTQDTEDMFRMLGRNEADIMLTLDAHVYRKDYIIFKERQMPIHFVAGKNSHLAGRRGLQVQDLLEEPIILTEKGMSYRRMLDDALSKQSLELRPVLEISRTDIVAKILREGKAVSFLPDFVTQKYVERGELVYLDVTDLKLDVWQQLIYHRNKWISRALETFIHYVSEHEFSR